MDESRSSFVTSTYLFGVDIVLEDVEDCNGVAFELLYNTTRYIKYSEYKSGTFGNGSKTVVIPELDEAADVGKLTVMVISGEAVDTAHVDNPVVIHLDFAVAQSAPHGSQVTFNFVNPHAVVKSEDQDAGDGQVLELEHEPIVYNIHGFIDVWPGDTNNDGVVNHLDEDNIALYYGWGSATKNMRSFKRPAASTLWSPQRVLAWDSSTVSYADCDGNGDITAADLLVLYYNHKKTVGSSLMKTNAVPQYLAPKPVSYKLQESHRIPVNILSGRDYIGASARIDISDKPADINILAVERGDIIDENLGSFFVHHGDGYIDIVSGSYEKSVQLKKTAVLANILVDSEDDFSWRPKLLNTQGITTGGSFFDLNVFLDIEEENEPDELTIKREGDYILVGHNWDVSTVKVFNYLGVCVLRSATNRFALADLPGFGLYYIQLEAKDNVSVLPFMHMNR